MNSNTPTATPVQPYYVCYVLLIVTHLQLHLRLVCTVTTAKDWEASLRLLNIFPDLWLTMTEYGYLTHPTIKSGVLNRRKYPPPPAARTLAISPHPKLLILLAKSRSPNLNLNSDTSLKNNSTLPCRTALHCAPPTEHGSISHWAHTHIINPYRYPTEHQPLGSHAYHKSLPVSY